MEGLKMQHEIRYLSLFGPDGTGEVRFGEGEQANRLVGLIPVNSLSQDLGGFRERLQPTAFRSTLSAGSDVLALVDHSREKLLGRSSNGTLRLAETAAGLEVVIDMPNTSYANDMRELAKRGDLGGLSFAFKVRQGGQRFSREGGQTIRDLTDIDFKEISVISAHPAYKDARVALRCANIDPEALKQAQEILHPNLSRCGTAFRRCLV
jgi:HK97 family phage prohead protease